MKWKLGGAQVSILAEVTLVSRAELKVQPPKNSGLIEIMWNSKSSFFLLLLVLNQVWKLVVYFVFCYTDARSVCNKNIVKLLWSGCRNGM